MGGGGIKGGKAWRFLAVPCAARHPLIPQGKGIRGRIKAKVRGEERIDEAWKAKIVSYSSGLYLTKKNFFGFHL